MDGLRLITIIFTLNLNCGALTRNVLALRSTGVAPPLLALVEGGLGMGRGRDGLLLDEVRGVLVPHRHTPHLSLQVRVDTGHHLQDEAVSRVSWD